MMVLNSHISKKHLHDIIAEIVRMSMASGDASNSHTLLSLNLDEHSESIRKEVSRRILRMPRVEGLVVNKQNAKNCFRNKKIFNIFIFSVNLPHNLFYELSQVQKIPNLSIKYIKHYESTQYMKRTTLSINMIGNEKQKTWQKNTLFTSKMLKGLCPC